MPGFETGSVYVGFLVNQAALGIFFSEFFGFPFQYHFI
jgi:hypothetical protein